LILSCGRNLLWEQAGLLAEKLARKREIEVGHREEFLRIQSMYMPRDLLQAMGLFELPSQCVVNIAPFDTHLLDIDISDLERYAPESLVGRLPKLALGADANMRGGNSHSLSDSGFQSGGELLKPFDPLWFTSCISNM
jgi:hypothetical protein